MGAACAAPGRVGRKWDDAEVLSGVVAARGVRSLCRLSCAWYQGSEGPVLGRWHLE